MPIPDDTRQRLIDAAGPLFADKGLDATSIRDITVPAGANVAAVHYYFGGAAGLYREAFRQAAQGCMDRAAFPDWPLGTPASRKVRDFIETLLLRVAVDQEPSWHPQLMLREMAHLTEVCAEFAEEFVRPNLVLLLDILRELLPDHVPEDRKRLCAFSIVGQILFYRFARPVLRTLTGEKAFQGLTVEVLTEQIYEFSLAALRSLAARTRREAVA